MAVHYETVNRRRSVTATLIFQCGSVVWLCVMDMLVGKSIRSQLDKLMQVSPLQGASHLYDLGTPVHILPFEFPCTRDTSEP